MQSFCEIFTHIESCSEDAIVDLCSSLKDIDESILIDIYPEFQLNNHNPTENCLKDFGESLRDNCLNKDVESYIQNYFNSLSSTYNFVDTSTSGIAGLSPSLVERNSGSLFANSAKQDGNFIYRPANIELKSDNAKTLSQNFRKEEDIGVISQLVERVLQASDFSHIISNFIVLGCTVRFFFTAIYKFTILDDNRVIKTLNVFKVDSNLFARFVTFLADKNVEAKDYLTPDGIKIMQSLKTFGISYHCRIRFFASSSSRIYCIQLPGNDGITYNTNNVDFVVKVHKHHQNFQNEYVVLEQLKKYADSINTKIYYIKTVHLHQPIEDRSLEKFNILTKSILPPKLAEIRDDMDKTMVDVISRSNNQIKNTWARKVSPFWTKYLNLPSETSDIGIIFMSYCTNVLIKERTDYIDILDKLKHHLTYLIHAAGIHHNDIRRNNIMLFNNSPILIDFDLASIEPHHIFIPIGSLQYNACGDDAIKEADKGEGFTSCPSYDMDMVTKLMYGLINKM